MLDWIQVLKFVFENPMEVSKHMVNVPFFSEFQRMPTCDYSIDGLVRSMSGLSVSSATEKTTAKRRLMDIVDSDDEEVVISKKKKKSKKYKSL